MNEDEVSNKARELLKMYNKQQVEKLIHTVLKENFKMKDLVSTLNFKI